jgi:hypothetical protein
MHAVKNGQDIDVVHLAHTEMTQEGNVTLF